MPPVARLNGYRQLQRAFRLTGPATRRELRGVLREVGDIVKDEAKDRFEEYSPRTAAGYRTVVRARGVSVEQSLRRTTGLRGDWGVTQFEKALIPAVEATEHEVEEAAEEASQKVVDYFELAARWQRSGLVGRV